MGKSYSDKLKDPRWINKRNEILDFHINNGIGCYGCGNDYKLHVHHKRYISGLEPWEYDNNYLVVLCPECHDLFHKNKDDLQNLLMNNRLFYSYEFELIHKIVEYLCDLDTHEIHHVYKYLNKFNRDKF